MQNKINTKPSRILIILALATLVLVACNGPDDREMLQTAKNYLGEQKIREAAIELRDTLKKNPSNGEARYLLGQINLDIGDNAAAEKEFRYAHKAGWQEEETQIGLARALINARKFQELLDKVEIKENYSPTVRANLYGLRAEAQVGLSKVDQAMETLATGAGIDENALYQLKTTIQLRLINGDLEGATRKMKQAISVHPDNPELLLMSAIMAIQGKNQASAMQAYQKVIDQDPAKIFTVYGRKARLGLARLEILEKNLAQAQSTLEPLVEMNDNNLETTYLTGMLAFSKGNYDSAEELLLKILKVAPEHSQTQLLFGLVNYAQQDYEQAAYYIAKYVNAVPENLGARKLLGRTYIMLGQQNEAQATLQTGLKNDAEDAELLALVGLSKLQGGDIASGITGLEHALQVNPENPSLRTELAKAYISAGETDHAIQQLQAILVDGGEEQQQTKKLLVTAYLRAKNFDQAINTALEMLTMNPKDPGVLTLVANVFIASDNKTEARKYFIQALQIEPKFVPATLSLARLEETENHYAEAIALYKGIIDADMESVAPFLALARLAESQGKKDEMFNWLNQARDRAPKDINSRVMLAEYYLRENQIEKAELMIKEAINIGPRQPMISALQSRILMADKRYNEALPILNELISRTPESVFTRALLGETYMKLGQTKDARRQLEIIFEKQPDYAPALILMVSVELQLGHYQQAQKYAEQIQKTQPNLYMGYELAGDVRIAKKEHAEAKTAYTQARDLKPSATLAIKISETLKRLGNQEKAPEALLAWLNDHPNDVSPLQFLGTTYQDIGQNDKAILAYEKVLVVQPDNVVSLNNLAWLYSLSNDPKALELAERAYQVYPDNVGIQDTYGWLLVQHGQADKGRRLLKQAMEKLSEVSEVRYHYAVALLKSGEKTEAHQRLNKLLQSEDSFEGKQDIKALLDEQ